MQTITRCGLVACLAALPLVGQADQPTAGKQNEHCSGTLSAVNPRDNTVKVKTWWRSRTFNLGDGCTIAAVDKKGAALSQLRPGIKVRIRYQNVEGVLVADQIAERALHYSGTVDAVDPKAGILTMAEAPFYQPFRAPRTFRIAGDCQVFLSQGKSGALAHLQPGDRVTITYELPGGSPVAYRIREKTSTFLGTIDAIDLSARTVEAKDRSGEKKFELAHQCQILVPGQKRGQLKEVALGQKYQFTYEDVNGINVLDRLAPAPPAMSAETASTR